MYKVKVTGEYVARSSKMDKEKIKKPYEIEGVIPTLTAALSIVKNKLLAPALSKKYPDYVTFLTYHIVLITPLTPQAQEQMSRAEISFMDRPSLIRYIKDNAIGRFEAEDKKDKDFDLPSGLDHRFFPDLFKLRAAVEQAKEDPRGFAKWFHSRKADLEMDIAMAKANPELFHVEQSIPLPPASISLNPSSAEKPKALNTTSHARATKARLNGLAADQTRDGEMGPMDPTPAPAPDMDSL